MCLPYTFAHARTWPARAEGEYASFRPKTHATIWYLVNNCKIIMHNSLRKYFVHSWKVYNYELLTRGREIHNGLRSHNYLNFIVYIYSKLASNFKRNYIYFTTVRIFVTSRKNRFATLFNGFLLIDEMSNLKFLVKTDHHVFT